MEKETNVLIKIILLLARLIAACILLPLTVGIILNIINPKIMTSLARMITQMNRIPPGANWLMLTGAVTILLILFVPVIIRIVKKSKE